MSKKGVERLEKLLKNRNFLTIYDIKLHGIVAEDAKEYCVKNKKIMGHGRGLLVFSDEE